MFTGIDRARTPVAIGAAEVAGTQLAAIADSILQSTRSVGVEFEASQALRPLRDASDLAHDTADLIARTVLQLEGRDTGLSTKQMDAAVNTLVAVSTTTYSLVSSVEAGIAAIPENVTVVEPKEEPAEEEESEESLREKAEGLLGGLFNTGKNAVSTVKTGAVVAGKTATRATVEVAIDVVDAGKSTVRAIDNAADYIRDEFDDHVIEPVSEAWHRADTFIDYEKEAMARRLRNPKQTMKDLRTLTIFTEEATAFESIVIEGGELYHGDENNYCGEVASCIYDVALPEGKYGMTIGHTIRFSADNPADIDDKEVAHEVQHVFDTETLGMVGFATRYYGEWLYRLITDDGGYHELWTEERAYEVSDNYDQGMRPSHDGPVISP